jgi:hypothetical protein
MQYTAPAIATIAKNMTTNLFLPQNSIILGIIAAPMPSLVWFR